MSPAPPRRAGRAPMPDWLVYCAIAGAIAALGGGYWDDAWHTQRGRDSFFIAPHLLIYGGVSLIAAALSVRVIVVAVRQGPRAVIADRPLALAAISVLATLASGPIDNAWHEAFGRDAVLWSPPHMLGIVGTLGLGTALLASVGRRPLVGPLVGGLVIAAATFPVAEYDTDVPQFSSLWYLPMLAAGSAIALNLVALTAGDRSWPRARAAAAHLGFLLVVSAALKVAGFGAPQPPLLIFAAAVCDLAAARRWPAAAAAGAFAAALALAYVPARNWLSHGVRFDVSDVVFGVAAAAVIAYLVGRLAYARGGGWRGGVRGAVVAGCAIAAVVALALPERALAHDPGQGREVARADLVAAADGTTLSLRGRLLASDCGDVRRVGLLARRGGMVRHGALRGRGCAFAGTVRVTGRGRWFLYAQLRIEGQLVETWLPVATGDGAQVARDSSRSVYVAARRPTDALKVAASVALYALMFALLAAMFWLVAPVRPPRPTTTTNSDLL